MTQAKIVNGVNVHGVRWPSHRTPKVLYGRHRIEPPVTPTTLPSDEHAIYELSPGLLLVFKPRGHRERIHTHSYAQRLRVIRGRIRVATDDAVVTIDSASDPLTLAAEISHATEALADTWLIAETVAGGRPNALRSPR